MTRLRAWRAHRYGDPADVLHLEEVEPPTAGAADVVIEVEAAALNFADVLLCAGRYQERPEPPFVPGFEVSGRVVAAGRSVQARVGARAVALTLPPDGGFQQLVRVPGSLVHAIPDALPAEEASAFHVAFTTTLLALERRARIRSGESLVVLGAAGALGSAAVQLGRALGAHVIAIAGGAKARACRALGADTVIDHQREDVPEALMAATGGRGADVVLDPVGGRLFQTIRRCLAFEARVVVVGFAGGIPTLELNRPLLGNYGVFGLYFTRYAEQHPLIVADAHRRLLDLYQTGAIRVPVRSAVPFFDLQRGFQLLGDREAHGRVVLMGPG